MRVLFELPIPSTQASSEPDYTATGDELDLSIPLQVDGQVRGIHVRFLQVAAFRRRTEPLCTFWHIEYAYDALCEVLQSDWLEDLRGAAIDPRARTAALRHFLIYLDSFASLEVIAAGYQVDG